jgi:predicted nucleic acid-binding protein
MDSVVRENGSKGNIVLSSNKIVNAKIVMLREAYDPIDRIDPSSAAYKALIDFLNIQSMDTLKVLECAKIKWVSGLARNRINRMKFAAKNLSEMPV